MKWLVKVAQFKILSAIPGGARLYKWAQKNVTRSLEPTPARVRSKMEIGLGYLATLEKLGTPVDLASATHIDLGTGWHPTVPLTYYALGCDRQWLFDVVPVLDAPLLEETVRTLSGLLKEAEAADRIAVKRMPVADRAKPLDEQLRAMGMDYVAPYMAKLDELSGSVDLATSTQVLLHIDRPILRKIFAGIFCALKPGGHFLATIHLRDLFAELGGISQYNHLRYSPSVWIRLLSSELMSFNRLKAPDYRALLEEAGFELPLFEVEAGSAADLEELDRLKIDPCFKRYTREDLAATHLSLAARKPR